VIAREQEPGVAVVVDFIDFECPHCRAMHVTLDEALARFDSPVRVVRKMVPLPNHRGAMPAAIAWRCAELQGKGDEMADALLRAPVGQLTAEGCARLAERLGLDLARYQADAADPATRRRIAADLADARAAGVHSLPTIYIGDQPFIGAGASADELVAALRRAAA
jgi:protein-disulfide isomerase